MSPDDVNPQDASSDPGDPTDAKPEGYPAPTGWDPAPQGWYPDPKGGDQERWWNGECWTDDVHSHSHAGHPTDIRMSKSRVAIGWVGGCLLGLLGAFALFVIFMMMAMNSWANNK